MACDKETSPLNTHPKEAEKKISEGAPISVLTVLLLTRT